MTSKLWSHLGLAQRAGKLLTGEEIVLKAVRSGEARLVIVADDASDNTKKKMKDKCDHFHVPIVIYGSRYELGRSIGKEYRVVVAVVDPGFTRLIRQSFENIAEVETIEERRK